MPGRIWASSFDKLRMRSRVFNGLALMVSLSNHGRHRFSAACWTENPTVWNCMQELRKSLSVSIICDLVIGAVQIVVF